jgi:hypothetical protein
MLGEYFKQSVAWHAACGRHPKPEQSIKQFLQEKGHLRVFGFYSPPWGVLDEEHDVALTDAQIKVSPPPPRTPYAHAPNLTLARTRTLME